MPKAIDLRDISAAARKERQRAGDPGQVGKRPEEPETGSRPKRSRRWLDQVLAESRDAKITMPWTRPAFEADETGDSTG
ncbi:hypothetical protein HKCCE3408_17705 [Rhodobacterales bacterium HKCCE3408]|nr:hypothetical protein [Rhodobacterales bacterium HKCCE3408]